MALSDSTGVPAAVGFRPSHGVVEKVAHPVDGGLIEILAFPGRFQDIVPGRQEMKSDAETGHGFLGAGKGAVEKDHEDVGDLGAGVAEPVNESHLRAAVGGQVLDQQHPLAWFQVSFDLGVAAEALGLLAHVKHRLGPGFGDPGGVGDARRLAAGDGIDVVETDGGFQFFNPQPNDAPTRLGKRYHPAAVDIDRAGPAGGQGIGLIRAEVDGADIQKQFRRLPSAVVFLISVRGGWHRLSLAIKMRPA